MKTKNSAENAVLVVGAGPAGLMAADVLSEAGQKVIVAEAKPSVARKFLMAGKSGLNLTKDETTDKFLQAYYPLPDQLKNALNNFGPAEVKNWAISLGQEVFTGSSGRVFPRSMKGSPLLRAWLARLNAAGVEIRTRWRWNGMTATGAHSFETPKGSVFATPRASILAMGGKSWQRLGSDGIWAEHLNRQGIGLAPFQPANMGFRVDWSPYMQRHFGQPVKNIVLRAGDTAVRGEFVVSERGLEGSAIYAVSRAVREGEDLRVDLLPDWSEDKVKSALARARGKNSQTNHMRKVLRLDPVKLALWQEFSDRVPNVKSLKSLLLRHEGPRPMDEAISIAGGVRFSGLDAGLMFLKYPSVFCAGEMLDWEAPTGGYLLTGCFATGRLAAQSALEYLAR